MRLKYGTGAYMLLKLNYVKPYSQEIDFNGHHIRTNAHYIYHITKMLSNGYSALILICGQQRVGKSKLGLWHALLFNKLFDKDLDFYKTAFYNPEDIIGNIEHRSCTMVDEAGDLFNRREFYKKSHRALQGVLQTAQNKNFVFIMISPFLSDLDVSIAKHFSFLIRVDARGCFKVFKLVKKFDAPQVKDANRSMFLDNCFLSNYAVPDNIWAQYEKYSFAQKERIREQKQKIVRTRMQNSADFLDVDDFKGYDFHA